MRALIHRHTRPALSKFPGAAHRVGCMCSYPSFVALCGIALLVTALAPPAGAAPPANVLLNFSSPPGTAQTQSTPVIRSFGDKVVALWTDVQVGGTAENKFHYAMSVDSGATFVDFGPLPPFSNAGVGYFWRSNPQLAIHLSSGRVFAAGVGQSQSGPLQSALAVVEGTFSGSTLIWSTPTFIRTVTGVDPIGALSLEAGPDFSLHLLIADNGRIRYQRSIDGHGAVWSAPVDLSSVADQGNVALPRLVAGTGNSLHAAWLGAVTIANQPIRYRSSDNLGLAWNAEQTAATIHSNPEYPGATTVSVSSLRRTGFSMAANRVSGSYTFGRVALAWSETWNFADEPFTALTGTVFRNEVEPNDSSANAVAFAIGEALRGTSSGASDVDFWKVTLSAGDPVLIWCDSTGVIAVKIFLMDTDGSTFLLNGEGSALTSAFTFRAPHAGTFYLQISPGVTAGNFYRVRTRIGVVGSGEAQDSRDVTVAYRDLASAWSAPLHHSLGPVGYEDYLPTIGFAADGLDYVTWYDLSRVPGFGSQSHLVAARNLVGSDPMPSPVEVVTTAPTDWAGMSYFVPPSMGAANDAWGDSWRFHMAWTDGRDQNPDAYTARLATTAAIVSSPADTVVRPGTTAMLRVGVLNRNPLFQEKHVMTADGSRSWPGGAVSTGVIDVATSGFLIVPIEVPDTAAAGVNTITVAVHRQSGVVLGLCQVKLTITNVTGVADVGAPRFALRSISPNPADGPVDVDFLLPARGQVRVAVYGIQGNRMKELVNGERAAGEHRITWDGRDDRGGLAPTGMYFVKVQGLGYSATRPVVLIR